MEDKISCFLLNRPTFINGSSFFSLFHWPKHWNSVSSQTFFSLFFFFIHWKWCLEILHPFQKKVRQRRDSLKLLKKTKVRKLHIEFIFKLGTAYQILWYTVPDVPKWTYPHVPDTSILANPRSRIRANRDLGNYDIGWCMLYLVEYLLKKMKTKGLILVNYLLNPCIMMRNEYSHIDIFTSTLTYVLFLSRFLSKFSMCKLIEGLIL